MLAHAILFEHLMGVKLKRAQTTHNLAKKKPKPCLLCQHEKTSESVLIGLFIKGLNDEEFLNTYKNKGLCCTKHYTDILKHKQNNALHAFKSITIEKYNQMHHHLAEIRRKNDYKHIGERVSKAEIKAAKNARDILHYFFDHL